jgi:ribosomal protein S24E
METKKDIKNTLLKRREIQIVSEFDKTPSFAETSKMLADEFKASEDQIMVETIKGKFGRKTFLISASIYETKELKDEAVKRLTKAKKEANPAA